MIPTVPSALINDDGCVILCCSFAVAMQKCVYTIALSKCPKERRKVYRSHLHDDLHTLDSLLGAQFRPLSFLITITPRSKTQSYLLLKVSIHPSVPNPIDLQLKPQAGTVDDHLECEIKIVKFDASRRRQPCEQTPRYGVQICGELAHVYEIARVGGGRLVGLAGNQVVRDDEGLARAEVACVVEGDGGKGGYCVALIVVCARPADVSTLFARSDECCWDC